MIHTDEWETKHYFWKEIMKEFECCGFGLLCLNENVSILEGISQKWDIGIIFLYLNKHIIRLLLFPWAKELHVSFAYDPWVSVCTASTKI